MNLPYNEDLTLACLYYQLMDQMNTFGLDKTGGSGLLAWHGNAPNTSSPRADGFAVLADQAEEMNGKASE